MRRTKNELSLSEAAGLLGRSHEEVSLLEAQGVLHPTKKVAGISYFLRGDLERIKKPHEMTLEQDAETFASVLQQDFLSSLSKVQRVVLVLGFGILSYILLVGIFGVLFVLSPREMAQWLGFYPRQQQSQAINDNTTVSRVLGVMTSGTPSIQPSLMQTVLQPVGKVSLGVVKAISPATYEEVTQLTILDPNDVLSTNGNGTISPRKPVVFPDSSLLNVADSTLIANLNSEYVQGRQPGSNVGDIAIIGENGFIQGLAPPVIESTSQIVPTESPSVSIVTGANLTSSTSDVGVITVSMTDSPSFSGLTLSGLGSGVMHVSSGGSLSSSAIVNGDITDDTIDLTAKVTGTLPVANGGTGATSFTANGIVYGNGTNGLQILAPGTSGYVLQTNGSGSSPSWVSLSANNAIAGLSVSNFSSSALSQWTNDSGFITAATTDTLTNKTIAAGSNTITGLTNSNLSGSAGITNANLANSALTITTGSGLSGGGSVSLGSGLTLTNTGVTSLTGSVNQVIVSQSTGAVSLSLPQAIAATSSPTFARLSLTDTSNQLVLGAITTGTLTWSPTSSRTLTLPDGTDTLVGKATTDTLTNKTLTAPVINGTVTTTGLTLPAYTASGNITGSGSPTLSSFGAINGLTLTASADGFTVSGGTTSRELTVTGADITIGSLIKPTSAGALTIQSNGANSLILDAGGAAGITFGTTNASSVAIGRTGVTTSIGGTASASALTIGGGTAITKHISGTNTFDASSVSTAACANLGTISVSNASVGDIAIATPNPTSGGIETLALSWNAFVSSAGTVTIRACNMGILGQDPSSQTWRADVWQH